MVNIQLLLLAAGASNRMGQPKQLLPWGNESIIEHQIKNLLATEYTLSVVLGAHSQKIVNMIEKLPVTIFINEDWQGGMGSSIAFGVKQLIVKDPTIDGILISLIDQPLLTTEHFRKMLALFKPGKNQIIVSKSNKGWTGAPVLFDKKHFGALKKLKGSEGAKVITARNKDVIIEMNAQDLLRDIDTYEEYQNLLDNLNRDG